MADLVVKNATVVTAHQSFQGGLTVKDGRIVAVGSDEALPAAEETIDADGLHLLPGFVDVHTHFREPGMTQKEDWDSGSRAAAAGGFTTIFDMPNCIPPTANMETFSEKVRFAQGRAMVDYGINAALIDNNVSQLKLMADAGAMSFKLFMAETVGKVPCPPDDVIFDGFRKIAETGLIVGVHAENDPILQFLAQEFREAGRQDPRAHEDSRPVMIEDEAVGRAIAIAAGAGNRLHIHHLSTIPALEHVRNAKAKGLPVTAEVLVSHLLLCLEEHGHLGNMIKLNPPVRTKEHREAMWEGLHRGWLDNIAADHAPHAPEEKLLDDIWEEGAGWPGLEVNISLLLDQVHKGKLSLSQLAYWYSENPARMWNIFPKKGSLVIGGDADFVLIDMNQEKEFDTSKFYTKAKFSPFEGWKVKGSVAKVFLRGRLIAENAKVIGEPTGRMIKPNRQT